jgi:hypothetical protein
MDNLRNGKHDEITNESCPEDVKALIRDMLEKVSVSVKYLFLYLHLLHFIVLFEKMMD